MVFAWVMSWFESVFVNYGWFMSWFESMYSKSLLESELNRFHLKLLSWVMSHSRWHGSPMQCDTRSLHWLTRWTSCCIKAVEQLMYTICTLFVPVVVINIVSRVDLNQHDLRQKLIRINFRNKCLSHELIRFNFPKTSLSQELSRLNYLKDETWFESRKFWVGHKSAVPMQPIYDFLLLILSSTWKCVSSLYRSSLTVRILLDRRRAARSSSTSPTMMWSFIVNCSLVTLPEMKWSMHTSACLILSPVKSCFLITESHLSRRPFSARLSWSERIIITQ